MSVKIINVLKDDSFNDILEIFRQSSASEVILVLPRIGKLFRHEDHFAAFASEAQQAAKVVSVLTSNPQTALLARKFGFTVMASGTSKTAKPARTSRALKTPAKTAKLVTAPPPGDFGIPDFNDEADLGDVPLTSDQTQGSESEDVDDADPLRNMHIEDEEGNIVDEDADGQVDEPKDQDLTIGDDAASFVTTGTARPTATLAGAPKVAPRRVPKASDIDGVRLGMPSRTLSPSPKTERAAAVPIQKNDMREQGKANDRIDYIDTVWRGMNAKMSGRTPASSQGAPSFLRRTFSDTARMATSGAMPKRIALTMVSAAAIVLLGVVYLMTGSARVALVPVGKTVDTQITVQAADIYTSIDDAFAKIPGQLIEVSKTAQDTVNASGQRDVASKARGKITVYNEYSSSPQALITNTRFSSSDGKIFRTLQSITVPGSTVKAGVTVPGKITVDVVADAPGSEYNIPAGNFIIMAFKERGDTNKVATFYGKSEAAMTGGASGPSVVVTKGDYDSAKASATEAVREQIAAALQAQGADLQVIDGDTITMGDIVSTANPDDAAASVTVTATGTIRTVAFRKQDLSNLIASTILKKERLVVLPDQLELTFSDIAFKSDLGTLVFTVSVKGKGYAPVDTEAIVRDIAGKNATSIRDYFRDREGVESATVTLSPFWVRSVPTKTSKISIDVIYSGAAQEGR
jgi:hypothetical protein